ncbi:hypothetical protein BDV98DRAFT_591251 [Pterulicium gracile]|uniref:Small secreted protein n=1 Tax=Pterulicium gracile TaxID=1884261 RepID=A0A5C3QRC3_9AGAR|nr:hypothetical protein BDV98DRAFT_591251 [Pterula gracilis]
MARFSFLALLALPLVQLATAAPLRFQAPALAKRQVAFNFVADYESFQISSGTAGDALAKASAIFFDAFEGVDLVSVDDQTVKDIETMRSAANEAETELFNPAISAADAAGDDELADALQRGKIANKVLKLAGNASKLRIQIAKAEAEGNTARVADLTPKLEDAETKMAKNAATDAKDSGLESAFP